MPWHSFDVACLWIAPNLVLFAFALEEAAVASQMAE